MTQYSPLTQDEMEISLSRGNNLPIVLSTTDIDLTGYTPKASILSTAGAILEEYSTTANADGDQILLSSNTVGLVTTWKITWTLSLKTRSDFELGDYLFRIQLEKVAAPTVPLAIVGKIEFTL